MPPAGQKRKREAGDNGESEPMQKQILPVASLPSTFDGEPEDGLQYLWTVRRDARRLPNHTRVDNPYKFPSIDVEATDPNRPPPSDPKLPSEEWRQTFERRFVNFRKNMAQPTINVSLPGANGNGQKLMPEKKDRDAWWSFLSGAPASVWDPPRQPKAVKKMGRHGSAGSGYGYGQSDYVPYEEADAVNGVSEDNKEAVQMQIGVFMDGVVTGGDVPALPSPPKPPPPQNGTQTPECDGTMSKPVSDTPTWTPREPTPSLLRQIDHRTSLHLLMYFTHWLNLYLQSPTSSSEHTPLDTHARWIFALLARVDEFCVGDEVSGLRSLARACISFVQAERKRRASEDDAAQTNDLSDEKAKKDTNETEKEGTAISKDGRMSEISCWMIVGAVVGVWAQRDLWMDAEEQLSRSA